MTQIHFVAVGVLLAMGFAYVLFRKVRDRLHSHQELANKRLQTLHAEIGRLRGELAELKTRAEEAEQAAAAAAPPRHGVSGLNLNHRTQALRLMRQGEPLDRIAASLGVPRSEIDLLFKVRSLLHADASQRPKPS